MDMSMFTSFDGRINRAKWWLGVVIIIVATLILYVILGMFIGGSMMAGFDPMAGPEAMTSMMRKAAILSTVVLVITAYPITALMKKRLNDRDRPDWLIYVFWAPTVINQLLALTGMGTSLTEVGGVQMPTPSGISWLVSLAGLAVAIWVLVDLGCIRGTEGPNQHGPDPLSA